MSPGGSFAGRSKDQDLIDEIAAWIQEPDHKSVQTNGGARAPVPSSPDVTDKTIIEKCRAALFDHGAVHAHHGGDDSRADLALLSMLAFWTQDEAQLERIFSSSALGQREKWRRRDDYRKRTIQKALIDLVEVYDWPSEHGRERGRLLSSSSVSPVPGSVTIHLPTILPRSYGSPS